MGAGCKGVKLMNQKTNELSTIDSVKDFFGELVCFLLEMIF